MIAEMIDEIKADEQYFLMIDVDEEHLRIRENQDRMNQWFNESKSYEKLILIKKDKTSG